MICRLDVAAHTRNLRCRGRKRLDVRMTMSSILGMTGCPYSSYEGKIKGSLLEARGNHGMRIEAHFLYFNLY